MNTNTPAALVCFFAVLAMLPLHAAEDRPGRGAENPDRKWDEIRATIATPEAREGEDTPEVVRERRAKRRKDMVAQADEARSFYRANPKHRNAREAKRLEALLLVRAVHEGEIEAKPRMRSVVEALKKDHDVPEPMRAEVAGLSGFMEAERETHDPAERRRAFTAVARQLVTEFPQQSQGYESLLTLALESDADEVKARLEDLIALNPPASVKSEAERHLERLGLVGEKFESLLFAESGEQVKAAIEPGKPIVLYSWASWSEGSIALARELAKHSLSNVTVLGLNLDRDVKVAQEIAQRESLPGKLLYDPNGPYGMVAGRLRIREAPVVFFIDAEGIVQDVQGTQGLQEKLSQRGL